MVQTNYKNHKSASVRTWLNCHLFRKDTQKSRQFKQAANAGVMNSKGINIVKHLMLTIVCVLPSQTWAWEFNPSLGLGLKYGGFTGFQVGFSEEEHNLRGAVGFFGISAGYDYKLLNNLSIGATTGKHANVLSGFEAHTLNVTYYVAETFSHGWNIGLDIGKMRCIEDCIDDNNNYESLSWFSLGYTF